MATPAVSNTTVPYQLDEVAEHGAIHESYTHDGPHATVIFTCDFVDHYRFIQDLVGMSYFVAGHAVHIPAAYYPPAPNLFCSSIDSIEPFGPPIELTFGGGWTGPVWTAKQHCRITVTFSIPKYDQNGTLDPSGMAYTTTRGQVSGEILTLPSSTYKFADGTPCANVGIPIGHQTITLTRHKMPFAPIDESASIQSMVNKYDVRLGDHVYPAGFALFLSMDYNPQSQPDGTWLYEVVYNFAARAVPWNFQMHPSGAFQTVTDSTGLTPFLSGDFAVLP